MGFKNIEDFGSVELNNNAFLSDESALLTAEADGKVNTMTIGWGTIGNLWGKKVVTCYVRPQRYTKELLDVSNTFSISVLPKGNKDTTLFLGMKSGRDIDKIAEAKLNVNRDYGIPFVEEAELVYLCKKLYEAPLVDEAFQDTELRDKQYPKKDYHTMYIAEVCSVLVRD